MRPPVLVLHTMLAMLEMPVQCNSVTVGVHCQSRTVGLVGPLPTASGTGSRHADCMLALLSKATCGATGGKQGLLWTRCRR